MIIFGTRGVTLTGDKGAFHCPSCGAGIRYEQKIVKRFFTLYFIPLIPLETLGEYVECKGCQNTYKPEVLTYDPAAEAAKFRAACHEAILRVMVRMTAADGRIDPSEVEVVRGVYFRLTEQDLSAEEVASDAASTLGSAGTVATDVAAVAPMLNDRGREMVLRAAVMVANADGDISEAEWKAFAELGQALGMSVTHAKGVLHECLVEATATREDEA